MADCIFCNLERLEILAETADVVAIPDRYPVNEGHTLVVPREHVESLFELPPERIAAVWLMVSRVRSILSEKYRPEGFTIGVNDGEAAGQTVSHAHIHVIPRYSGDVIDPRGGIRQVIPERAAYWSR
jgi:diadenosine tetraphosphate (Ap4A) HIT family hydrolase